MHMNPYNDRSSCLASYTSHLPPEPCNFSLQNRLESHAFLMLSSSILYNASSHPPSLSGIRALLRKYSVKGMCHDRIKGDLIPGPRFHHFKRGRGVYHFCQPGRNLPCYSNKRSRCSCIGLNFFMNIIATIAADVFYESARTRWPQASLNSYS